MDRAEGSAPANEPGNSDVPHTGKHRQPSGAEMVDGQGVEGTRASMAESRATLSRKRRCAVLDYLANVMGDDVRRIAPGETAIVSTRRRQRCEQSYADPHPVMVLLCRNRCLMSVRPELEAAALEWNRGTRGKRRRLDAVLGRRWTKLCAELLPTRLASAGWAFYRIPVFWLPRLPHVRKPSRAIIIGGGAIAGRRAADGFEVMGDAAVDAGEAACAVVHSDRIVSEAYTIDVGNASIGSIGIETAAGFRKRGFAHFALSVLTRSLIERGRSPLYTTSFTNKASVALARSVGFRRCATILRVQPK
jgi:hypothetical protein